MPQKILPAYPAAFLSAKGFPSNVLSGGKVTHLCHRLLIKDLSMFQGIIEYRENHNFHSLFGVLTGGTKTALSHLGGFQRPCLFGLLFIGK